MAYIYGWNEYPEGQIRYALHVTRRGKERANEPTEPLSQQVLEATAEAWTLVSKQH
jgi:hypothetical protein